MRKAIARLDESPYDRLSLFSFATAAYARRHSTGWDPVANYLLIGSSVEDITDCLHEQNEDGVIRLSSRIEEWNGNLKHFSNRVSNKGVSRLPQFDMYVQIMIGDFDSRKVLFEYSFAEPLLRWSAKSNLALKQTKY